MATKITVTAGTVITVKTSKRQDRNCKGIICQIPGNPDGYLPITALVGRTEDQRAARMKELQVPGVELEVLVTDAGMKDVEGKQVPRIRLNEFKVAESRRQEANKAREQALAAKLADFAVGTVFDAVVDAPAETDSTRNPGTKHRYGVFVNLGEVNALLHGSEVAGGDPRAQRQRLDRLSTGSVVTVKVIESAIENGRIKVRVSEKQAVAEEALASLKPGSKVAAHVLALDSVADVHGVVVDLGGGIKGFLPEDLANVKDIGSLIKSRGQTTKVIITGESIGEFVKVTRKGV